MKKLLFLTMLASLAFACKTKQTAVTEKSIETNVVESGEKTSRINCEKLSKNLELYNDTNLFRPNISKVHVNDKCVSITYSYSGCGAKEPTLVWDKVINEEGTFPEVRLRFLMENPGMCEAFFKDSMAVDFSGLRTVGNKVLMIINDRESDIPLVDFQN